MALSAQAKAAADKAQSDRQDALDAQTYTNHLANPTSNEAKAYFANGGGGAMASLQGGGGSQASGGSWEQFDPGVYKKGDQFSTSKTGEGATTQADWVKNHPGDVNVFDIGGAGAKSRAAAAPPTPPAGPAAAPAPAAGGGTPPPDTAGTPAASPAMSSLMGPPEDSQMPDPGDMSMAGPSALRQGLGQRNPPQYNYALASLGRGVY